MVRGKTTGPMAAVIAVLVLTQASEPVHALVSSNDSAIRQQKIVGQVVHGEKVTFTKAGQVSATAPRVESRLAGPTLSVVRPPGDCAMAGNDENKRNSKKTTRAERPRMAEAEAAGKATKRRPQPTSGAPSSEAAELTSQTQTFDIGDGESVRHTGDESWGVVGQRLRLHNSFWQLPEDGYSAASVVGFAGRHQFSDGSTAKHAYVIECEGHHYVAKHGAVAGALVDPAVKRRVRNAQPPRLL